MKLNERNIFLLDGMGALSSLFMTGLVLPLFSDEIGIPVWLLRALALYPIGCAIYSFGCFRVPQKIEPWMLKMIMIANAFYCMISMAVMLSLESLTTLGIALLISEIFVVSGVVAIELSVYKKSFPQKSH